MSDCGHEKMVCKHCGDVIFQCRCMSEHKYIRYGVCDACRVRIQAGEVLPVLAGGGVQKPATHGVVCPECKSIMGRMIDASGNAQPWCDECGWHLESVAIQKQDKETQRPPTYMMGGRQWVDRIEMESYCIGSESAIAGLRNQLLSRDGLVAQYREMLDDLGVDLQAVDSSEPDPNYKSRADLEAEIKRLKALLECPKSCNVCTHMDHRRVGDSFDRGDELTCGHKKAKPGHRVIDGYADNGHTDKLLPEWCPIFVEAMGKL